MNGTFLFQTGSFLPGSVGGKPRLDLPFGVGESFFITFKVLTILLVLNDRFSELERGTHTTSGFKLGFCEDGPTLNGVKVTMGSSTCFEELELDTGT